MLTCVTSVVVRETSEEMPMNHHPLVVELLARAQIEDFLREAQIARLSRAAKSARRSRATSKPRWRHTILRRKASPAC